MTRTPPNRPLPGPDYQGSTWSRPSQGLPPRLDRHYDTYANRFDAGGVYDEPDFTLNDRGVHDEPGYALDEPYESRRRRPDDLQSNYDARRTLDHAGYGPASESQPAPYDDSGVYRPSPYAPPLGDEGPGPDDQAGAVFGESRPDLGAPAGPRRAGRPDDRIEDEVIERLAFDPRLRSARIQVIAENRVVTLRGTVDAPRDREHAADIAHAARGVRAVHNLLQARPRPYRP